MKQHERRSPDGDGPDGEGQQGDSPDRHVHNADRVEAASSRANAVDKLFAGAGSEPADAPSPTAQFEWRKLATMLEYLAWDMRMHNHSRLNLSQDRRDGTLGGFDLFSVEDVESTQLKAERLAKIESNAPSPTAGMPNLSCPSCGHTHTGAQWGYICIGCPCDNRPKFAPAGPPAPTSGTPPSSVGSMVSAEYPNKAERSSKQETSLSASIEPAESVHGRQRRLSQQAIDAMNDGDYEIACSLLIQHIDAIFRKHDAERTAPAGSAQPPSPTAGTPQHYELRIQHARKQGEANGFQDGWHAALQRVREGDRVHDLAELVPHHLRESENAGTELEGRPGKPGAGEPHLSATSDVSTRAINENCRSEEVRGEKGTVVAGDTSAPAKPTAPQGVVEALGTIAGSNPANSHQPAGSALPPVEPVDVVMTGTRTGTREEYVADWRNEWRKRALAAEAELARLRAHQEPSAIDDYIIDSIIQDVVELPDRTSPDDWPEACLVTAVELNSILRTRLRAHQEAPADPLALLRFVRHLPTCTPWGSSHPQRWWDGDEFVCDCGLAEAVAQVRAGAATSCDDRTNRSRNRAR